MLASDIIKIAQDFIEENPLGTIGTVDKNDKPWGAVVYLGCDNQFNLYFTTKSETRKHQNLMHNPALSIVFANEESQMTIQAQGEAVPVTDSQGAQVAADVLTHAASKKLNWVPPLDKLDAGSYQLYKITTSYARLSGFNDPAGKSPTIIEYKSQ